MLKEYNLGGHKPQEEGELISGNKSDVNARL